jgi:hypothetical protein
MPRMQPHEAVTILTPAVPLSQLLLSVVTMIVAGAYNLRAAHNMARIVRESRPQEADV